MLRELSLYIPNQGTRQEIREKVVHEFLKEEPGAGTGDLASKYKYYVETLRSGNRIFLSRPAYLNKGFDFVIRVEGINFNAGKGRARENPTHGDLLEDLEKKKEANSEFYKLLYELIQQVYFCNEVRKKEYKQMIFEVGFPIDFILLVIKWLFIEQDITYWNFSGRAMFMSKIPLPNKPEGV